MNWLKQIKETTELNIRGLEAIKATADARSKVFALKLRDIFDNLKSRVDQETQTVTKLQESLIKNKTATP